MESFKAFFEAVIPFAIVGVLVALAVVFYHLSKLLIEVKHSVEDVNHKLLELDEPVKTVVKVSSSINSLHDSSGRAISGIVGGTSNNVSALRSALKFAMKQKSKKKVKP